MVIRLAIAAPDEDHYSPARTAECRIYVNSPLPSAAFRLDSAAAGNLHNPSLPPLPARSPYSPFFALCARWNFSQIYLSSYKPTYPTHLYSSPKFSLICSINKLHTAPNAYTIAALCLFRRSLYGTQLQPVRAVVVENLTRVPSKREKGRRPFLRSLATTKVHARIWKRVAASENSPGTIELSLFPLLSLFLLYMCACTCVARVHGIKISANPL